MSTGYSGTPLARKLGIKEGHRLLLVNEPEHYFELFSDFPDKVEIFHESKEGNMQVIHFFCQYAADLRSWVPRLIPLMNITGMFWISWPKGSSKIETDLKRDFIRVFVLEAGLVDVKVAAIDQNWSGLKFVYRLKDR